MHSASSISSSPWLVCYYPIPKHLNFHHHCLTTDGRKPVYSPSSINIRFHCTAKFPLFLAATYRLSKGKENKNRSAKPTSPPIHKGPSFEQFPTCVDHNRAIKQTHKDQHREDRVAAGIEAPRPSPVSFVANMWWAGFKSAFGQRINVEGIVSFVGVVLRDRQLAIPHVKVPDIRYIDWAELKRNGFQGVVFDKDNTITVPYSLTVWPAIASSLDNCKLEFGDNIAVYSNSAGLYEYDSDGRKAKALESAIGIKVIKHGVKKPVGTAEEIEKLFGCQSSRLVMVGDRPFTDVVFGNRNGFFTILTEPLSLAEEPFIVKQVRKLETALVNRWSRQGIEPFSHKHFPDAQQCVKDLPHF